MAGKRKKQKRLIRQKLIICIFLCVIVVLFSYCILLTDMFHPSVNEVTASYISFNNRNTTDMLKIMNVKKMSDKKGDSAFNTKALNFSIELEKDSKYEIAVVSMNHQIDEQYIHYALDVGDEHIINHLNTGAISASGERIIYQGENITKTKVLLRIWISPDYNGEVKHVSFEIKVRPR